MIHIFHYQSLLRIKACHLGFVYIEKRRIKGIGVLRQEMCTFCMDLAFKIRMTVLSLAVESGSRTVPARSGSG